MSSTSTLTRSTLANATACIALVLTLSGCSSGNDNSPFDNSVIAPNNAAPPTTGFTPADTPAPGSTPTPPSTPVPGSTPVTGPTPVATPIVNGGSLSQQLSNGRTFDTLDSLWACLYANGALEGWAFADDGFAAIGFDDGTGLAFTWTTTGNDNVQLQLIEAPDFVATLSGLVFTSPTSLQVSQVSSGGDSSGLVNCTLEAIN